MNMSEQESIKAFVDKTEDKFRRSYGRRMLKFVGGLSLAEQRTSQDRFRPHRESPVYGDRKPIKNMNVILSEVSLHNIIKTN